MAEKQFDFFPFSFKKSANGFIIPKDVLFNLTKTAFEQVNFTFSPEHINHLIDIKKSENASKNDRYTATCMLKNAQIASAGILPLCQDTGIAQIFGFKNGTIFAENEENTIQQAVAQVYKEKKLRNSTVCADSFFTEYDAGNNLPAQIMLFQSTQNDFCTVHPQFANETFYRFLFCAKGGGSANKTLLFQNTKADMTPKKFEKFLQTQIKNLGTSACPPYTIAVVAGGLSAEQNLLVLKLATCNFYDSLSATAHSQQVSIFRDFSLEKKVLDYAAQTGFGAQFGGKAFAHKALILRLPRHAASFPVSIGVSCAAHRNLEAYVTKNGIYIQKMCTNPAEIAGLNQFEDQKKSESAELTINTNDGIKDCLKKLIHLTVGTKVFLNGKVIVARDQVHAKWKDLIQNKKPLPSYCTTYPICYAGPSETPQNKIIGSFGPTTAGRMDSYADMLLSRGASLITIAKGNRSKQWKNACKKYGGVYLGTIGGVAALFAEEHIVSSKIIDYAELGMESVRLIEVKNLPVFVLINAQGEDFFERVCKL